MKPAVAADRKKAGHPAAVAVAADSDVLKCRRRVF
jgi:hypothetical protein